MSDTTPMLTMEVLFVLTGFMMSQLIGQSQVESDCRY